MISDLNRHFDTWFSWDGTDSETMIARSLYTICSYSYYVTLRLDPILIPHHRTWCIIILLAALAVGRDVHHSWDPGYRMESEELLLHMRPRMCSHEDCCMPTFSVNMRQKRFSMHARFRVNYIMIRQVLSSCLQLWLHASMPLIISSIIFLFIILYAFSAMDTQ